MEFFCCANTNWYSAYSVSAPVGYYIHTSIQLEHEGLRHYIETTMRSLRRWDQILPETPKLY